MKSDKKLYVQNQILENIKFNNDILRQYINGIQIYSKEEKELRNSLLNYDFIQYSERFEWKNLPSYCDGKQLELMFYCSRTIACCIYNNLLTFLPCYGIGNININGLYTQYGVYTFNGEVINSESKALTYFKNAYLYSEKEIIDNPVKFCIVTTDAPSMIFNKQPTKSRYLEGSLYTDIMSKLVVRTLNNTEIASKKISVEIPDQDKHNVLRNKLKQEFTSTDPFLFVSKDVTTNVNYPSFEYEDYFGVLKNVDSLRCATMGVKNNGFDINKKERLIVNETDGNDTQRELVLKGCLYMRKRFCEFINKYFKEYLPNGEISVEINECLNNKQQINFNNPNEYKGNEDE